MKCKKCNAENLPDAKFCRTCGAPLNERASIIDDYPEYDLILAAPFFEKCLKQMKTGILASSLMIGYPLYCYFKQYKPLKNFWKSHRDKILYIENPNRGFLKIRRYFFYIDQNQRWGLLRNSTEISIRIPASYDSMKWRERNKLIEAKSGGRTIIMDIDGNIYK